VLGRLLAGAGRAMEAEAQERAVIAHHRGRERRDEDALVRAELRLSRLLVHRGEPEGEALLRAIIARAGDPPDSLIEAHAALAGLLEDRGSAEAAVLAARGAALADRYCEEPLAMDVLRLLLGPWGDDDGAVQWPTTGAVLQASHGRISNPLPLDEHGHPTPDGVRSEVVFGPLRPFACSCGKYAGLRSWGTICEVCRVAVEAVTPRRSRFGHVALATPAVHPAATTTIARLLDLDEPEVIAIRDFESQLAGDSGPAALESALRNLYLEGEAERLAEATAQGRLRGRAQLIADSAATVATFLRDHLRPEALILHALPVLPPDLDPAVHPALRAKGRSEIEQAYARVLTTNAAIEQLVAAGAPLETASVVLQRDIDALIGLFASLPAIAGRAPPGDTHRATFEVLPGTILLPAFDLGSFVFSAGKAFVLDDPAIGAVLAVTCLHLFGPAGGLPAQMLAGQVAHTVESATLDDAFDETLVAITAGAIEVPGARASDDFSDVAALALPTPDNAVRLHLAATDPRPGERVYLAAPVRAGAPRSQRLHPATVRATTASGSTLIEFDVTDLDVGGTSGAPLLSARDTVAGMMVRFQRGRESGILLGTMVPASRLRELLRRAIEARQP